MKEQIRSIYFCDFCNKRYLSKYWAQQHELHCTANPNRDCRMCDSNGSHNDIPAILDKLHENFLESGQLPSTEEIKKLTEGCPNCMLTVLRQVEKDPRFTGWYLGIDWNYQEEVAKFWRTYNQEQGPW